MPSYGIQLEHLLTENKNKEGMSDYGGHRNCGLLVSFLAIKNKCHFDYCFAVYKTYLSIHMINTSAQINNEFNLLLLSSVNYVQVTMDLYILIN